MLRTKGLTAPNGFPPSIPFPRTWLAPATVSSPAPPWRSGSAWTSGPRPISAHWPPPARCRASAICRSAPPSSLPKSAIPRPDRSRQAMRALLLAAGLGTRLRPLTDQVPKCLVTIRGRPLLSYWLDDLLEDPRVERVLINTHHLHEQVRAFVTQSRWSGRIDLVHETELLGTGGTILANRAYFGERPLFVAHADNLTDVSLGRLIDAHLAADPDVLATLLAFRTE